jgi:hypothetical protein
MGVWLDPMSKGFDAVSSTSVSSDDSTSFRRCAEFLQKMIFELRVVGARLDREGYGQAPAGDSSREPRSISELMKA